MDNHIKEEKSYKYIESSPGKENLMLLHGLFGALSNFKGIIDAFGEKYNVVVPILPIYELPILQVSLTGLVNHLQSFVDYKGFDKLHVVGNSLGGHIGLIYSLQDLERISTLTLTGSSGLYESGLGNSFPKRGDYEFMKKKTEQTFYDPAVATKELVDEVYEIVNDKNKAIRVIYTAKSAIRHNLGDKLHKLTMPTLLIWGENDIVTPPFVAEKFHELLPNSELVFIEKCGHAPMMEYPDLFNKHLGAFLEKHKAQSATT